MVTVFGPDTIGDKISRRGPYTMAPCLAQSLVLAAAFAGCATSPPGANFPKTATQDANRRCVGG